MARESLLAEVATRYYVDHLSQQEIARRLGRSVPTVSRLLAKAHAEDVVEVRIRYPVPVVPALQAALVDRFGLRTARVARTVSDDDSSLRSQISDLAARYISTLLRDDMVIAASWGSTVLSVIQAIAPGQHRDLHVVQGLGSLGSRMPTIDNPLLVRMLAERLNATPHYLPAPMIVESVSVRDALARDPYFRSTLDLCGRADVALIGIGAADPDQSGPVRAGYLTPAELERTRADGAVGDIVVEYYDLSGHILETEFGSRVMGMRQQQLRNAGTVIAVAGGAGKVAAILGAVRTGLIDVLVTDNVTARQVLELDDAAPVNDRAIPELAANPSPGSAVPSPANNKPHRSLLDATFALLDSARDPRMSIAALSAEADRDMRKRWRSQLVAAITRASEKGEPGATIDPGSLADMLLGAIWYRSLIEDTPADEAVIGEIIGSVEGTGEARPKAES